MTTKDKIAAIRRRIIQVDTEGALQELLAWLETSDDSLKAWADSVRSLKVRYRRTKQEKQRSTISYEQAQLSFNKVENDLLSLLQSIEAGKSPIEATIPASSPQKSKSKAIPWLTIGVVAALVLAGVSFFLLRDLLNTEVDTPSSNNSDVTQECPYYPSDSEFNIMVLPYKPLRGEQENIESSIKDRLALAIEKYEVPAYVMTYDIDVTDTNRYPSDSKSAKLIGDPCSAQLVIWGTTERTSQDQIITTTSFRFLDKEHFNLTDFTLDQNADIDTLETISSIATEGVLTENIEIGIRLIFGLVAHETGRFPIAANLIQEACDSLGGVKGNPKWGMLLADSYVRSDQPQKAIETYDAILESDQSNTAALAQRGYITFELGEYAAAEEAFTKVLDQDTTNENVRVARAAARVRTNQLYKARQDIEHIEETPDSTIVVPGTIKEEYKERRQNLEKDKSEAEKRLLSNPQDTVALGVQSKTAQNLGDFETASEAASRILVKDPKRIDALKTLIEIKPMLEDTEQVHEIIERSRAKLPAASIPRVKPLVPPKRSMPKNEG